MKEWCKSGYMLHGNSHMYQISDSSQQVFSCTAEVTYK